LITFKALSMKNILFASLVLIGFTATAQLSVKPTATDASFVFVNDTFIFVEEDVALSTNRIATLNNDNFPSVILRGEAQLLQNDDTAPSGNTQFSFIDNTVTDGTASFPLSVFNSPTSIAESNPALREAGLNGSSANGGTLNIASFWLFSFNASSAGYTEWDNIGNTGQLNAGFGFSMKGVSGSDNTTIATEAVSNNPGNAQRYDFRGRPNTGSISGVTVGVDEDIFIGNPYPSAMDLSYFLLENSADVGQDGVTATFDLDAGNVPATNTPDVSITRRRVITGIAYFWESDPTVNSHRIADYQGGYGTFSPMGVLGGTGMYIPPTYFNYDGLGNPTTNIGTPANFVSERRFSPVGQGFFVQGVDANQGTTSITFSNRHRVFVQEAVANNSQFRTAQINTPVPGIGVDTYYPDVTNMAPMSQIYLAVGINDLYSRQLGIGLIDGATEEFDAAIDAPMNGSLSTDVAFASEYTDNMGILGSVIAGVPKDEYQWIPLKVQVLDPSSELRVKVFKIEAFDYDNVFLYDSLTDTFHDILNDETVLRLDEATYTDRFYVRFTTEEAPVEEETSEEEETTPEETDTEDISISELNIIEENALDSFTIIQNNVTSQLEIYNTENNSVKDVALFDLGGKMIFQEADLGDQSEFTFSTANLATGVYIVQFTTLDGLTTAQKISVTN